MKKIQLTANILETIYNAIRRFVETEGYGNFDVEVEGFYMSAHVASSFDEERADYGWSRLICKGVELKGVEFYDEDDERVETNFSAIDAEKVCIGAFAI